MKTIIFFCMAFLVAIILLAGNKPNSNKLPADNTILKALIISEDTPVVYIPEVVIYGNRH